MLKLLVSTKVSSTSPNPMNINHFVFVDIEEGFTDIELKAAIEPKLLRKVEGRMIDFNILCWHDVHEGYLTVKPDVLLDAGFISDSPLETE